MDNQELCETFQRHLYVIKRQTADITYEQSLLQPPFRGNCMNWVLGHMLETRNIILQKLGQPAILLNAEELLYKHESAPITPSSPAVPLDHLIAGFEAAQAGIEQGLASMTEAQMATVIDEGQQSTLRSTVSFLAWHEAYHLGQLEYLRQLTGVNDKVI